MTRLQGKVAVITGAASGIGEACAKRFLDEGARVVIADLDDVRGEGLAVRLGGDAVYARTDVSSESDVRSVVALAVRHFGRLDCMFNNAGFFGPLGKAEDIETEAFDRLMAVLVRGVFLGIKHAAPVMKSQGAGAIINTASIAGLLNGFGPHPYNAAKAAVIALTRSTAMELGRSNVRVNAICPGGIVTPMAGNKLGGGEAGLEVAKKLYSGFQPIPRPGTAEDIASAAVWLASDDGAFVNGASIVVDGGAAGGMPWSPMFEQDPTADMIRQWATA